MCFYNHTTLFLQPKQNTLKKGLAMIEVELEGSAAVEARIKQTDCFPVRLFFFVFFFGLLWSYTCVCACVYVMFRICVYVYVCVSFISLVCI